MSDNESTNPVGEVEAPAQEVVTDQAEAQDDATEGTARDEKGRFTSKEGEEEIDPTTLEGLTADQVPEDVEEIDYEGERYAVPKKIKDAIMRNADYTRKTQEIAEQKKAFEAAFAEHKQNVEIQQAEFEEYTALNALNKYLEQFRTLDWSGEMEKDPIAANQKWMEYQTLKDQYSERNSKLQHKQQERALQTQRETARRAEEGRETLRQTIKGWSPETESNLKAYAKEVGIPNAADLQFAMHPQETKIIHKAYLYDQLMKKAQQKPKAPDAKPVNTVGQASKSNNNKLADDLPIEEWARRWREKQLRT